MHKRRVTLDFEAAKNKISKISVQENPLKFTI